MASVGAALAVVFTLAGSASVANASQYRGTTNSHYTSSSYGNSYSNNRNNNYSYNRPAPVSRPEPSRRPSPVVISRPQIIYQEPQVVYQEPQVVVQEPEIVYQQPQIVYQESQPIYETQPVSYAPSYYQSYSPLSVSCNASPSSVAVGQSVTWQAYASGGTGIYDYAWSGTNGSSYNSSSANYSTYYTSGSYSASVTVYSNGQSITQSCGYVSVIDSYAYNYPTTVVANQNNNNGNLVAACFANRTTASIGTPITWAVEVTGGAGQYTYSWSGSDGLTGSGASATQTYDSTGLKDATVLISSGGQTVSQACGDSVSIHRYVSPSTTNYQGPAMNNSSSQSTTTQNSLSAAALLGLGNIPWGWIGILIILILGVTIFYLLFNRHKI